MSFVPHVVGDSRNTFTNYLPKIFLCGHTVSALHRIDELMLMLMRNRLFGYDYSYDAIPLKASSLGSRHIVLGLNLQAPRYRRAKT